jgi:lysophospholipase L1-like esterase
MPSHYRSRFQIALLLILNISLAGNLWLFQRSDQYYRELHATRLDPLGLNAYASAPPSTSRDPQVYQHTIVFFGDSRAADWPAPTDFPNVLFLNRGIGAQTSAQAVGRFNVQIPPLHPDLIVIQVGINDLKTIPLFPDQATQIVADCKTHIRQLVEQARRIQATVIVTTIMPVGQLPLERRLYWSEAVRSAIAEVNASIESLQGPEVIVLDTTAVLADAQGQLREDYSRDFLHLNEAGYAALNQMLASAIRRVAR